VIDKKLYHAFSDMAGFLLIAALEDDPLLALTELNNRYSRRFGIKMKRKKNSPNLKKKFKTMAVFWLIIMENKDL
jgi:hypothetical protein